MIRAGGSEHDTHSLCRSKATPSYRKTQNLRRVRRLLGHAKRESAQRCRGIEVNGALQIAGHTRIWRDRDEAHGSEAGPLPSGISFVAAGVPQAMVRSKSARMRRWPAKVSATARCGG
jgi:hypothetical protein